jgi:hypothetical protein
VRYNFIGRSRNFPFLYVSGRCAQNSTPRNRGEAIIALGNMPGNGPHANVIVSLRARPRRRTDAERPCNLAHVTVRLLRADILAMTGQTRPGLKCTPLRHLQLHRVSIGIIIVSARCGVPVVYSAICICPPASGATSTRNWCSHPKRYDDVT